MKSFGALILLLFHCFCITAQSKSPAPNIHNELIVLYSEEYDTFKYSKEELDYILKKYPELDMPQSTLSYSPKEAYLFSSNKGIEEDGVGYDFFSEVGRTNTILFTPTSLKRKMAKKSTKSSGKK